LINQTWQLLERERRTIHDDDQMIHTAHASRYHWGQVLTASPVHLARGEWLISRVYAVLGRAEPALHHAGRVLDLCQGNGIGDFDLAFAYEALARASAVAGDSGRAGDHTDHALAATEHIADDEDRDLVLADLETIPASQGTGGRSQSGTRCAPAVISARSPVHDQGCWQGRGGRAGCCRRLAT
jgi:hypothetical protein